MNKRYLFVTGLLIFVTSISFCQNLLENENHKRAELFIVKKGYDVQQRLEEIKSIVGKEVTVYQVSGKQNKVKSTYTGIAEMSDHPKFSDKQKAGLIIVRTIENGVMRARFPLTNDRRYRIYLTEKMN